jgi:hypothetical protein
MHIEKPKRGNKYFFFGIFILQKGAKNKKTRNILKAPNKSGLTE